MLQTILGLRFIKQEKRRKLVVPHKFNLTFVTKLVEDCGWRLVSQADSEGPIIGDSFGFAAA